MLDILLMAYGSPYTEEEVEPYYTDIRRGNPPPPELLEELIERYRTIGKSPLNEITFAQAEKPPELPQHRHQQIPHQST